MKQFLKHIRHKASETYAQATVEYLIVGLILFGVIVALGALGSRVRDGLFAEYAAKSASHAVTENTAGSIGDVLLY